MMIKNLSLFLLLLCSTGIHSQTLKELDNKNGFKQFLLGTSIENYEEFYSFGFLNKPFESQGKKYLNIKNTEYNKIGDIPIRNINLQFSDDKLNRIEVDMEYQYSDDLYTILKEAFGIPNIKPYEKYVTNNNNECWAEWQGQIVSLKLEGNGLLGNMSHLRITFSHKITKEMMDKKTQKAVKDL